MSVRRAEPSNAGARGQTFAGPRVASSTPQFPYPSVEVWHRRPFEPSENARSLVGVPKGKVLNFVGEMTVRDDRLGTAGRAGSGVEG